MDFLIILWIILGLLAGFGLAFIEGKVNHKPPRYRNALLWTLLAGPIGFCVVGLRSCLTYVSTTRQDQRDVAEAARQQMAERKKASGQ